MYLENSENTTLNLKAPGKRLPWKKDFKRNKMVYLLFLPIVAFFVIFNYVPMVGILISFQNYKPNRGIFGSEWVGFNNFMSLFQGNDFILVLRNTAAMALMNLTIGYVFPIILALLISQAKFKGFRRTVQTISYMPYFVATVVICSLLTDFLSAEGIITQLFMAFGMTEQNMLANPKLFWWINTFSEVWQGSGYGAIIFVASIANINPQMHEAAAIDGAGRWRRLWHITIPSILPTIITMLTLKIGLIFVTGFDKILLLYMPKTYETADVLTTYVYRMGIGQNNYGLASAAGLFQSVIATALLLISNKLTQVATKISLF